MERRRPTTGASRRDSEAVTGLPRRVWALPWAVHPGLAPSLAAAGPGDNDGDMAHARVVLPATPPFRLDLTVWVLRRRKKTVVDRWNNGHYSRTIVADGDPVRLTVSQDTVGVEPS